MKKPGKIKKPELLVLFTGGTIGMGRGSKLEALSPARLRDQFRSRVPELGEIADWDVEIVLNRDSAHVGPTEWRLIAEATTRRRADGIVVLHGTDTMAYTAAALSFLLGARGGLRCPVVLTGSMRPLGELRTDAHRNLISAAEVAARAPKDSIATRSVTVFFDRQLYLGTRVRKRSATEFDAFESPSHPAVGSVGAGIDWVRGRPASGARAPIGRDGPFESGIAVWTVAPGFPSEQFRRSLRGEVGWRGVILRTFPSGTAPTHDPEFLALLEDLVDLGIPCVAVRESAGGRIQSLSRYEAAVALTDRGVIDAGELTFEAAWVKMGFALAGTRGVAEFRRRFQAVWTDEATRVGLTK